MMTRTDAAGNTLLCGGWRVLMFERTVSGVSTTYQVINDHLGSVRKAMLLSFWRSTDETL
jgi:hypothetical protein